MTPTPPEEKLVREYVRVTERNEWEGETWHFYIPSDHPKLAEATEKAKAAGWEISHKRFTEKEVETLVGNSDSGYMAYHNEVEDVDLSKEFYKGSPFKLVEYS